MSTPVRAVKDSVQLNRPDERRSPGNPAPRPRDRAGHHARTVPRVNQHKLANMATETTAQREQLSINPDGLTEIAANARAQRDTDRSRWAPEPDGERA